jgi:hypothetical protein
MRIAYRATLVVVTVKDLDAPLRMSDKIELLLRGLLARNARWLTKAPIQSCSISRASDIRPDITALL